jgi:hypothetical protein
MVIAQGVVAGELPDPLSQLELGGLLGVWYVLFSNRPDWQVRTHAQVEIEALESDLDELARLRIVQRFRSPDLLGRTKARLSVATALAEPGTPRGRYIVHGHGLARVSISRVSFPFVDPERRWAAAWHSRSSLGGAAGLDLYSRDPWIPQSRLDAILATVRAHPFFVSTAGTQGLFATVQDWIPPEPYRLA